MPRYLVNVENHDYDIELEYRADGYKLKLNGRDVKVTSHKLSDTRSLLFIDGWSYEVDIDSDGYDNRKNVFIRGIEMPVEIEDFNLARLRKTAGMKSRPSMDKVLKAPMPGLILEIKVATGDRVKKGQPLLVIEAMKMENVIKSQGDGTVKAIFIEQGISAEKGDKLLEFE